MSVLYTNENSILSPPQSPLPKDAVVEEDNNKLTENENEFLKSENNKPLSEDLVESETIAIKHNESKDINIKNDETNNFEKTDNDKEININLETPINTVEKIIISPPTANDISEESSLHDIKTKSSIKENEETINQELLAVSPILEECKLSSSSGHLKENASINKCVSIKSGSENSKINQHPPPLPRKDLIYNRRSYIEPSYYSKYIDKSKRGQSLILNEGVGNTSFRSPSLTLYTAEPQDTASVAEGIHYAQSEIIEPYNQSFYMMSPSCANIDLDCLKDIKDSSSKKSMSIRLKRSTNSINKQIKKIKKPIAKAFSTSSNQESIQFSLDASEDVKINDIISHLTAQYESLDQFMLDTEQKNEKV